MATAYQNQNVRIVSNLLTNSKIMRTRKEVINEVENAHYEIRDIWRQKAVLEVLLDIRELLQTLTTKQHD